MVESKLFDDGQAWEGPGRRASSSMSSEAGGGQERRAGEPPLDDGVGGDGGAVDNQRDIAVRDTGRRRSLPRDVQEAD